MKTTEYKTLECGCRIGHTVEIDETVNLAAALKNSATLMDMGLARAEKNHVCPTKH